MNPVGQVLYADLDVSDLRTPPEGRIPIRTGIRHPDQLASTWERVRAEAAAGEGGFTGAREALNLIFLPGFSTKEKGWGIGRHVYDVVSGNGVIDDCPVRCISPQWMIKFHSGYADREGLQGRFGTMREIWHTVAARVSAIYKATLTPALRHSW